MATIWSGWYWHLGLASLLAMGGAIASGNCAIAQVTPDVTLGAESSVVTPGATGAPVDVISGGATRGANLFHSFEQFSVLTGGEAYFNNAPDIQNILTRVTGGSISNIDGLLRANGTANLFLINPNGIIFGSNATLNIGGSFMGSTASSLNFADGTQFSATNPQITPLLTINVPLGLQFGGSARSIQVQGDGRGTRLTSQLIDTNTGLRVQPNQTLAIVGGDVTLLGGTLKTGGGRIELGSVAGTGLVNITPANTGWALGYEGAPTFGDIQLSQQATVDASGSGGGNIQVQGRRVTLTDGSRIEASTLGPEPGGMLTVNALDSVELIGESANDPRIGSSLFTAVYPKATGAGGSLTVETRRLIIRDGAGVSSGTLGMGLAGTLTIKARESVELNGTSTNFKRPSFLTANTALSDIVAATFPFPVSATDATGQGGDLRITTAHLFVRDGAEVTVSSLGSGDAGNLEVVADSIRLDNQSILSGENRAGQGNIILRSGNLVLRRGSKISTNATGTAEGGNITIGSNIIAALENSDISANALQGSGGRVRIDASGIFGTEFRENNTSQSDITASSNLGLEFSGTVEINNPDVDPTQGLVELPAELVDVSNSFAQGCPDAVWRGESKFIITGRGGLPPSPTEPLRGDNTLTNWSTLDSDVENRSSTAPSTNSAREIAPTTIVEANGWVKGPNAEVTLVATAPTANIDIPWLPESGCNAPKPES